MHCSLQPEKTERDGSELGGESISGNPFENSQKEGTRILDSSRLGKYHPFPGAEVEDTSYMVKPWSTGLVSTAEGNGAEALKL